MARADERDVLLPGQAAHQRHQALQPLAGDVVRHGVLEAGRGRPLPRRILERVGVVEADFLDERQGLLEVLFGLAGEPDDDVGRERDPGYRPAQRRHHGEIARPVVAPQHPLEHA